VDERADELPIPGTQPEADHAERAPALDALADAIFEAEATAVRESPLRRPASTYRLQLHAGFRLRDVEAIVPYLHDPRL
jgi:hypothetical protein